MQTGAGGLSVRAPLASLQRRTQKCELNEPSRRLTSGSGKILTHRVIWEVGQQTHLVRKPGAPETEARKIVVTNTNAHTVPMDQPLCRQTSEQCVTQMHFIPIYIHGKGGTEKVS